MKTPPFLIVLLVSTLACGERAPDSAPASGPREAPGESDSAAAPARSGARPAERVDTILIEGMPEAIRLRLFRTGEDFPLPFSAYIPADMTAETSGTDSTGSVQFVAEFGGQRNTDAYIHTYVFPPATDRQRALAEAHGYTASRGVPVSQGLEPIPAREAGDRMPWAIEGWRFRYQTGGRWFAGSIGVGERQGRFFQIVEHFPAEYGDGFGPRAALITRTWHWADGTRLRAVAGDSTPTTPPR